MVAKTIQKTPKCTIVVLRWVDVAEAALYSEQRRDRLTSLELEKALDEHISSNFLVLQFKKQVWRHKMTSTIVPDLLPF